MYSESPEKTEAMCTTLSHQVLASVQNQFRQKGKRLMDIGISFILLILLAPVLFFVAILIRATSAGPALFRQTRVGANGVEFRIFKFRTMKIESCRNVPLMDSENKLLKLENDPRITSVGRWLRRASLDEFPQLLNVLRGDMSLIGPRPLPDSMLQAAPVLLQARAVQKPGMTGLWQIRDRKKNTCIWHMLPHDLEYVATLSLRRDAGILLKTLKVVIRCDGAV